MLETIAGGLTQGVGNLLGTKYSNDLAAERESQARRENFNLNELAAENAKKRMLDIYNMIQSPEAMLRQYQAAGLSPSLMFAGNGIGGQTSNAPQGEGASGISPTSYGVNPIDMASIRVANAQADKLEQEAISIKEKRGAEIENIVADTKNKELKSAYYVYENRLKEIETDIADKAKEYSIDKAKWQCELLEKDYKRLEEQIRQEKVKSDISEETKEDIIKQIRQQTLKNQVEIALTVAQTELAKSNITLNDESMNKMAADVFLKGEEIDLDAKKLSEQVKQWTIENQNKDEDQAITIGSIIANTVTNVLKVLTGK